jgi:hypothetical protein
MRLFPFIGFALLMGWGGCDAPLGLILGERPLRALVVTASESDQGILLTAEEPVGGVSCRVSDPRRDTQEPWRIRVIWWARCPGDEDCFRSIRYGESLERLETLSAPEPLRPSSSGECYDCNLVGSNGKGQTWFRLSADGKLEPCPFRPGQDKDDEKT